jgi:hypothetical protein
MHARAASHGWEGVSFFFRAFYDCRGLTCDWRTTRDIGVAFVIVKKLVMLVALVIVTWQL